MENAREGLEKAWVKRWKSESGMRKKNEKERKENEVTGGGEERNKNGKNVIVK